MKRTPLKRRNGLARARKAKAEGEEKRAFQEAAMRQGRCAFPLCRNREGDAHHVVYEQHLRREGLPRFDPRNALRLCRAHHDAHHNGSLRVPRSVLKPENAAYLVEVLGEERAEAYLRRHYG